LLSKTRSAEYPNCAGQIVAQFVMQLAFAHLRAPCAVFQHIGGGDEEEMLRLLDPRRIGHAAQAQIDVLHQIGDIGLDAHPPLEKAMKRLPITCASRASTCPRAAGRRPGSVGEAGFLAVHPAVWAPEPAICQAL
jgi:hypothetical protein